MTHAVLLMASVVLWNHTGLCATIEKAIHYRFRVLSCSKCTTFWSVLLYLLCTGCHAVVSIATAFALSYMAIWVELLLGYLSVVYESTYVKIQTAAPGEGAAHAESEMPEVRE